MLFKDRIASLHTIVSSIGDAMIACDLDEKIIFYNPAAVEMLGPDLSEASAKNYTSNFGVFKLDKVTPFPIDQYPLYLGLKGIETNDVEHFIRNKAKPNGLYVSITGRPILGLNSEILGSVVAVRDISSRKKSEEDLHSAVTSLYDKNLELLAANKELESFSYAVSHDLRTPLRGIIGFSNILIKNFSANLNAEGLSHLHRINESCEKLELQIDGLLELARLTRGKLKVERVDLSEMVKEIADLLKLESPERKSRFEIAVGVFANADKRLLQSVMQNLIDNAWKFTAKKAEAIIEFGVVDPSKESPIYFVKDNGAGFNEKYSSKLFNIFQRLHAVKEFDGNGIGLATVQKVIHRHGGTIRAEGKVNEGATFYFTL